MASSPITALDVSRDSLDLLFDHYAHLRGHLAADPDAASVRPPVEAFATQIATVEQHYRALSAALLNATAAQRPLNRRVDRLILRVSAAIHGGRKVDPELPLHKIYFGTATVHGMRRLGLQTKKRRLETWPSLLANAKDAALEALATEAAALITEVVAKTKSLERCESALKAFRIAGEGAHLFEAYNALGATTLGALKAYAYDHPDLELSADWGPSFFLRRTRSNGRPTTLDAYDQALAKAEQVVSELRAGRAALVAALADEERAEQDVAAAEKDLKAVLAEGKAVDKKTKAAKAKLEQAKRQKKSKKPGTSESKR